jgi:hypothetical protein
MATQDPLEILRQKVAEMGPTITPEQGRALDPYFRAAGFQNTGATLSAIQKGLTPLTQANAEALWRSKFGASGNMAENISYALSKESTLEDFAKEIGANPVEQSAIGKGLTLNGEPTTLTSLPNETATSQAQTTPQFNLNFRYGLTDAQKNSITKMLGNRANSPLNETDARNLNYALGGNNWEQYVGKTSSELGLYSASTTGSTTGGTTGGTGSTDYSNLPAEITSSQEWQNATDQNKSLVAMIYKAQDAIKSGDQALIQDTQDAIKKAVAAADPYFKQKILLAQDQINRSVASLTGDYTSSLKSYEDKIKQLKEDLIFNKDQLTLSQQQEMSEQLRNYQNSLYNTQQQLAEAGLAFSSPRQKAESNLMAEQQGVAQSTQRKYAQAFREQELTQQRQTQALQQNIADLERKKQEGLTDITRKGEAMVGTANMPTTGVNPLGGITGSIDYEKQGDITQLTSNYLNWANLLK